MTSDYFSHQVTESLSHFICTFVPNSLFVLYNDMMEIKTGCDIVSIKRFEQSARRGDGNFLGMVFSTHELANAPKIESRAGIFAAKESVIKALGLHAGDWKKIEIAKNQSGRPSLTLHGVNQSIASNDISISHDGEYAIAVALFLIHDS